MYGWIPIGRSWFNRKIPKGWPGTRDSIFCSFLLFRIIELVLLLLLNSSKYGNEQLVVVVVGQQVVTAFHLLDISTIQKVVQDRASFPTAQCHILHT
jgi:hypothetical protein